MLRYDDRLNVTLFVGCVYSFEGARGILRHYVAASKASFLALLLMFERTIWRQQADAIVALYLVTRAKEKDGR